MSEPGNEQSGPARSLSVGDDCPSCGRTITETCAGGLLAYCWWCNDRTDDGLRADGGTDSTGTEQYGWVARQRARLGAFLVVVGASIHPFENERVLGILQEAISDENRAVDTGSDS